MTSYAPRGYTAPNVFPSATIAPGTLSLARAQAAAKTGNHDQAIGWFEKALAEAPDQVIPRIGLGASLHFIGRFVDAKFQMAQAGRQLLSLAHAKGLSNSETIAPLLDLCAQMQRLNDFDGAVNLGLAAIEICPNDFRAHQQLSVSYSQLNRTADALLSGQRALELAPHHKMMHILQASLEADAGQHVAARARLEQILKQEGLSSLEAFRAHKELARVLDRLNVFDEVFPNLHAAAQCAVKLPEMQKPNKAFIPKMVEVNKAGFDRALMARWAGSLLPKDQPPVTFVMGYMRSGTTLTQEVLDAHPEVLVADEQDFVFAMHRELHRVIPTTASTPEKLRQIDFETVLHLRAFYWNRVRQRFGEELVGKVFVDKNTMNTIELGLISCIFPDAKIVFVLRDPRDICVSCYMQLMAPTPGTVHLLDWQSNAAFYALVMDWWIFLRPQMSAQVLEFRYEDAVLDFETTFKRIFQFMGVSWDASVADFHKRAAKKFVATPSRNQVAQPLYTSSVTRWRHFEGELNKVKDVLTPFVEAFNYEPWPQGNLL